MTYCSAFLPYVLEAQGFLPFALWSNMEATRLEVCPEEYGHWVLGLQANRIICKAQLGVQMNINHHDPKGNNG